MSRRSVAATGTDRGNEVLAHMGARLGTPMAANCLSIEIDPDESASWQVTRVRWGGSLLERARLRGAVKLITFAPYHIAASPVDDAGNSEVRPLTPELSADAAATMVQERVVVEEGLSLSTAAVVVAGGRGVGSADGFEALEELAELLGGAVGCSRVATNNGWRSHRDQVGQTGTIVAPDLYIAAGISGAIQHWVGMMNSKHVLAINIDRDAPMVTKADWAVVGDLHDVVPEITAELRKRKGS